MTKSIVVVGGGPAGLEAARAAALSGAAVTLVSDAPPGGRAGWHSLVPSKVWLHAADTMGIVTHAPAVGIGVEGAQVDPAVVLARIREVAQTWNGHLTAQAQALGVDFVTGTAAFAAPTRVKIDGDEPQTLDADAFIIAAGSVPLFPPAMKPDGQRVLAPRFASKLTRLPRSMVVVGGGATGSEFAYLFNRLGVDVTWVVNRSGILPMFAPGAGEHLGELLQERGLTLAAGNAATAIESGESGVAVTLADGSEVRAEQAFLAIGRRADVARLGGDAAGLACADDGAVTVDQFCRTNVPSIYAVGDVTGLPMLANQAVRQAQVAGRHAAGAGTLPYRPEAVVHAIYSDPQVAQVGDVNGPWASVRVPFAHGLKAHLLGEGRGYLELFYELDLQRIRGAVAVGPHAADILAPVAVAIQCNGTLADLSAAAGAYPTVSELAGMAAYTALN